jgi:hypothetical protein
MKKAETDMTRQLSVLLGLMAQSQHDHLPSKSTLTWDLSGQESIDFAH